MLRVKFGQRSRYFDSHVTVQRCTTIAAVQDDHSLLPPRSREFEGRGTLVLDLDETLVYIKCERGCLVNCQCGEGDGFYVAKRPCVDDFLQLMAANFEVVLWTASPQPYAEAALGLLDPEGRIFAHRLYRQHCVGGVKDLSRLGRDLSTVVVVDDQISNIPSALLHNAIAIKRFIRDGSDEQEQDVTLQKLGQLLTRLARESPLDFVKRLDEFREEGLLDAIKGVGERATPWLPSWRRDRLQSGLPLVAEVQMPIYVPVLGEKSNDDFLGLHTIQF